MKTEQIRLIQDTYTVPAEVDGYLVTCPGCGARINLYDMYHGFCPWCESSMKKHTRQDDPDPADTGLSDRSK